MYEYGATVVDIHDGDTLHLEVDLGLDIDTKLTVRLYGLNAPELSTPEGKAALVWVQQWFTANAPTGKCVLHTIKDHREKYGRYLGVVLSADLAHNLND